MGFKCPVCHKDFGSDKNAFSDHMKYCSGFDIENVDIEVFGTEQAKNAVYVSTIKPLKDEIERICNKAGEQE